MHVDFNVADTSSQTALRHYKLTGVLIRSTLVAALGGMLFGFDTALISGTTRSLTVAFGLGSASLGITVSSALWGTIVGAIFAGFAADRFGRRDSLRFTAALYLLSALGCAMAGSWPLLLTSRILGGLGIGGSSVLGPMYIAEVSPAHLRGRLVGCFQLNIVIGIMLAYLSNFLISLLNLGATEWRWQFAAPAIPSIMFLALLFAIPRSPRWLVRQGRLEEARKVLATIAGPSANNELKQILNSVEMENQQSGERLFSRKHRRAVLLAMTLASFCQLSGINAVLYYLNDIFAVGGSTKYSSGLQTVIVGVTNLIFTVLAMSVIDKFGRRLLLLIGSIGLALTLSGIATIFQLHSHRNLLLWLLLGFCASFSFSLGPVTWVYISEVFPNNVRGKGLSLGSLTHWVVNAVISGVFPVIAARSGALPFVFFALMMIAQFFIVLLFFPETKNVALEDMSID
jgi:SP family arabinose:H+ symporter-like MFS transporter